MELFIRRLAIEGRLGILQANICNKEVLEEVTKLEGYQDGNNVIYFSNVIEVISRQEIATIAALTKPRNGAGIYVYSLIPEHKMLVPVDPSELAERYDADELQPPSHNLIR